MSEQKRQEFHLQYNMDVYFVSREAGRGSVFPESRPYLLYSGTLRLTVFGMSVCMWMRIWKQL